METFTAEDYDAQKLVRTARLAAMRIVNLNARNDEGFSLYDPRGLSDLDVTQTPCGRDLVQEFVEECHRQKIVPMLFHTTLDWNDARFESEWDAYQRYLRDSVQLLCTKVEQIGGFLV